MMTKNNFLNYELNNNSLIWKNIEKRYGWYGSKSDNNYSVCYYTTINPKEFILLTSKSLDENFMNFKDFNLEEFNNEPGDMFLIVRLLNNNTGEIVGCDGRHRMYALAKENIKSINILLFISNNYNKYNPQELNQLELINKYNNTKIKLDHIENFAHKNMRKEEQ